MRTMVPFFWHASDSLSSFIVRLKTPPLICDANCKLITFVMFLGTYCIRHVRFTQVTYRVKEEKRKGRGNSGVLFYPHSYPQFHNLHGEPDTLGPLP